MLLDKQDEWLLRLLGLVRPRLTNLHVSIWDNRSDKLKRAPSVLFIHGSGNTFGEQSFEKQKPLAQQYRLLLVDRRGFGESPIATGERGDFANDAIDIIELLEENSQEGVHVVGHSYGAIGSMIAAAERPEMVRSLTVIEPPMFNLATIKREFVVELIEEMELNFSRALSPKTKMLPIEYWTEFTKICGFEPPPIEFFRKMSEKEIKGIRTSMTERPPWEACVPFEKLANSQFAKLVVSGGWKKAPPEARERIGTAYILVCETLQSILHAEWAIFEDADHWPQQLGESFNKRLIEFLSPKETHMTA